MQNQADNIQCHGSTLSQHQKQALEEVFNFYTNRGTLIVVCNWKNQNLEKVIMISSKFSRHL